MNAAAGVDAGLARAVGPEQEDFPRLQGPGGEAEAIPVFGVVGEVIALQIRGGVAGVDEFNVVAAVPVFVGEQGEVGAAELVEADGRWGRGPGQKGPAREQEQAAAQ